MKSAKDGLGLEYVYQFNEKARRGGTAEYFDRDEFRGQRTAANCFYHDRAKDRLDRIEEHLGIQQEEK